MSAAASCAALMSAGPHGIDALTVLMLHMDGANAGTVFTDSSASAHTSTATNATTSTTRSQFGVSSASFNGSTTSLNCGSSADYNLPADFTVDFWMWSSTAAPVNSRLFCTDINTGVGLEIYINSSNFPLVSLAGNTTFITGAVNITNSAWHHIAVSRSGTSIKLFVDGVQTGSTGTSSATLSPSTTLILGALHDLTGQFFTGNIDEFRISKGIARWTTTFTPEARAYAW